MRKRKQCVVSNDMESKWSKIIRVVPQGSVFRSLLFLVYINDLEKGKSSIDFFLIIRYRSLVIYPRFQLRIRNKILTRLLNKHIGGTRALIIVQVRREEILIPQKKIRYNHQPFNFSTDKVKRMTDPKQLIFNYYYSKLLKQRYFASF